VLGAARLLVVAANVVVVVDSSSVESEPPYALHISTSSDEAMGK